MMVFVVDGDSKNYLVPFVVPRRTAAMAGQSPMLPL